MKLAGAAAARFLARPDADRAGVLLHGADAMRVALKRQDLVAALIGPEGEAEMRLARIAAADLRKDPAALQDAIRAQGFFPGPRVAFVEDAGDALAPLLATALADWRRGDAALVVTAAALGARSPLRKLFEERADSVAIGIYDDPPSRDEILSVLAAAGLTRVGPAAEADLVALATALDPGDFRQTVEKLALYMFGETAAVTPADIAACAPATIEAEVDDLMDIVADGRSAEFGAMMQRISGQGVAPVTLAIAAMRHFRMLYSAKAAPGGPASGLARMRPPVFGPRKDRLLRQAQAWSAPRLEEALRHLLETDLALRSSSRAPAAAVIERALLRLARMPHA
jgi:DNA polymerase-3 subunit delta